MPESPKIYLLLGPKGSGRRSVFLECVDSLPQSTPILYFRHESDSNQESDPIDQAILKNDSIEIVKWKLEATKIKHSTIRANPECIFFLAPAVIHIADVIEGLKGWLEKNECSLTRIISIVHCGLAKEKASHLQWFEASMHFSDMVLLNRRELVGTKWVQDFIAKYKKIYHPTRFELIKKDRLTNPMDILDYQVFRNSLYFDSLTPIEEDEIDELMPEDQNEDPYIERLESGRRMKPIPLILD